MIPRHEGVMAQAQSGRAGARSEAQGIRVVHNNPASSHSGSFTLSYNVAKGRLGGSVDQWL
jgi:hypothetical protein